MFPNANFHQMDMGIEVRRYRTPAELTFIHLFMRRPG
jgi:hypothetical protein